MEYIRNNNVNIEFLYNHILELKNNTNIEQQIKETQLKLFSFVLEENINKKQEHNFLISYTLNELMSTEDGMNIILNYINHFTFLIYQINKKYGIPIKY